MSDRLQVALIIGAVFVIGAVGTLLALPWFLRRKWSVSHGS